MGGVRLADGTQLAVANYAGCQQRSAFAGHARYGYARSQHRFISGVRLVLLRLVIESVFANLKGQMRLEQHLAKTPAGLAVRIAQRILALTIGMLLNTLTDRPARALAVYDAR